MITAENFWDKTAQKYAKSPIKNMAAYNETMDHIRKHLSKDDSVLEVGCGTGTTALLLAEHVTQITASDISSKMIEIANGKAIEQKVENATFIQATLFDDSLEKGSYDVIMAFNFLHLLEDIPAASRRINELLKPDGIFISKTVCLAENFNLWPALLYILKKIGIAPYIKNMKIHELEKFITDENFQVLETGVYPASPPSRFIVARKM